MSKSPSSPKTIEQIFTVPVSIDQAFKIFTAKLDSWWPKEYTWAGEVLETIKIESKKNGRCFERGPHDFELDWGRVIVWEPPTKIIFTWQIDPNRVPVPNPEKVSEVEVLFEQKNKEITQIKFKHRKLDNHGEEATAYRDALNSPQGWPYILNKFKEACS